MTSDDGRYGYDLRQSPDASDCSVASVSDDSMDAHKDKFTPPESPGPEPPPLEDTNIGRLSLEDNFRPHGLPGDHGEVTGHAVSSKRPASEDLPREPGGQSPGSKAICANRIPKALSPSRRPPRRTSSRKHVRQHGRLGQHSKN